MNRQVNHELSLDTLNRAHIAGRLNSGFDREIGALPPHIYYINWGDLVRASRFRSGFRRPAMWALEEKIIRQI
jgi:hypothetical protein